MEECNPLPPSLSGQPDLFALDLKVESFTTNHPSGLKSYFKGRVLKWVVDRKSLTVDAMMSNLAGVLKFGVNQRAHVWYSDRSKREYVCLNHASQLPVMFGMHLSERFIELVVNVSNILAQNDETIQNEPTQDEPSAVAHEDISQDIPTQANSETEYTDDIDPFDLPEEYVGVDDEHIYVVKPKTVHVPVVQMLDDDEPAVHGDIREVAIDDDDDPSELIIAHDPQDPVIKENDLFPDMVTFRKFIRHYAIKKDFEFGNLKRTLSMNIIP